MNKWQNIKTAKGESPLSATRLLLWVADGGIEGTGAAAFGYVYKSERSGATYPRAEGYSGGWKITHWMPLPEAPSEDMTK